MKYKKHHFFGASTNSGFSYPKKVNSKAINIYFNKFMNYHPFEYKFIKPIRYILANPVFKATKDFSFHIQEIIANPLLPIKKI